MMAVFRSFRIFYSLLQVKITPSSCEPFIPKCSYRGRGRQKGQLMMPHDLKLSEIPDETQVNHEFIDPDEGEKFQSFDDFYNTFGERGPSASELKQYAKKEREKLKLKILKRKYFKDPTETNLLTWEAKEQIHFLHREFPEDWTVDKLAQSFPCSKNGIIKLLKSSYAIKTPKKILEHDLKVKKNWKELEAELSRKGGPVNPQYKMFIESGKLDLMKNAASLKGAPKRVLQLEQGSKIGGQEVGIFSSIVKDYSDDKRQKERMEEEKLVETNESDLNKLLAVINVQPKEFNQEFANPNERSSPGEVERPSTHENSALESPKIPRRLRRRIKGEEVSIENLSYLEAYQMKGTGKVMSNESEETNMNTKVSGNVFTERDTRKYFKYSVQQYPSPAPNRQNFNDTKHQSWDPSFKTQIKIPEHLKHKKGVVFKKNDTYYDEDGEILYRVPIKE